MQARWLTVALVPLGTLGGHVLGYLMAGRTPALDGAHSHLAPVLWPALGATAAALVSAALLRSEPGRRGLRLSGLLVAQVVLFGFLEAAEHVHAGHHGFAFVTEPSFRCGAVAQVVSAGLLVLVTRLATASGRLVRAGRWRRPRRPRPAAGPAWPDPGQRAPSGPRASSVRERGPPGRFAAA